MIKNEKENINFKKNLVIKIVSVSFTKTMLFSSLVLGSVSTLADVKTEKSELDKITLKKKIIQLLKLLIVIILMIKI